MNQREIEQLERKSLYSTRLNKEIKESVNLSSLNELTRILKTNYRKKNLIVLVIED